MAVLNEGKLMSLRKVISKNIRTTRQALGLTLEELAKRTKLSPQYLNRLERTGTINITADNLEKLALGLDVTPSDLVASASTDASSDHLRKDLDSAMKILQKALSRIR